jgi:hypothetical protein
MDATNLCGRLTHRQRDVHGLGVESLLDRQLLGNLLLFSNLGFQILSYWIELSSDVLALLGWLLSYLRQSCDYFAFLSNQFYARIFEFWSKGNYEERTD